MFAGPEAHATVILKYMHMLCLNSLRSSPATLDPSLVGCFYPFVDREEAVRLHQKHRLHQSSHDIVGFGELGGLYEYSEVRPRPLYSNFERRSTTGSRRRVKETAAGQRRRLSLVGVPLPSREGSSCTKVFEEKKDVTGGLLTAHCEHDVCIAFFILPLSESRNSVFSYLITRLPRPPRVIVYDFGCQLAEYCLNREPEQVSTV